MADHNKQLPPNQFGGNNNQGQQTKKKMQQPNIIGNAGDQLDIGSQSNTMLIDSSSNNRLNF